MIGETRFQETTLKELHTRDNILLLHKPNPCQVVPHLIICSEKGAAFYTCIWVNVFIGTTIDDNELYRF